MEYVIARSLGRTHAEMLDTISSHELTWQKALLIVEQEEAKEANEQEPEVDLRTLRGG